MNEMHAEVLELPLTGNEKACRGYTKRQCEVLEGRAYATFGNEGVRIGKVVGSYAYRYGDGRVQYGLLTEQKFTGGKDVWKGSLNRADVELDRSAVMLRGELGRRVKAELATNQKPSTELLADVKRTVHQEQSLQVSRGRRR